MTRPDPGFLDDITAVAEQWVRRCNGQPAEGKPVSRKVLRAVLAGSTDISADENGIITWTGGPHEFTAEPTA